MKRIFAPATALMSRLKYPQRFALITFLFLLPLVLALSSFITENERQVAFSQKELVGTEYIRTLTELYDHALQARILGVPSLINLASDANALKENEAKIDRTFEQLVSVDNRLGATLQSTERLNALLATWNMLKGRDRDATRDTKTGEFITQIRNLIVHVSDTSNIILDPDLDTYYLQDVLLTKLPERQKFLSDLSALGYLVIIKRGASPQEIGDLVRLSALSKDAAEGITLNLGKAQNNNPVGNVKATLDVPITDHAGATTAFHTIVRSQLIDAPLIQISTDSWLSAVSGAIQEDRKLWNTAIAPFEALVEARVSGYTQRRELTLAVSGLVLVLVAYMWVGFYLAVMRTANSLKNASAMLESGSMADGMVMDTRDELGSAAAATFSKLAAATNQMNLTIDERTNELTEVAAVLAYHHDGIVITDEAGTVKVLNGAASKILYTSFDVAVGRNLVELTRNDGAQELLNMALQTPGQHQAIDLMIGGRIISVVATFVPISGDKQTGLITMQDITEYRQLQRAQQQVGMAALGR